MIIYLAGPLDEIQPPALDWRQQVASMAVEEPLVFFSPQHAFLRVHTDAAGDVITLNQAAIYVCDGVLASLNDGFPFGTIREIEFARAYDKPVAIVRRRELRSLAAFDCLVYTELEPALLGLIEAIRADVEIDK